MRRLFVLLMLALSARAADGQKVREGASSDQGRDRAQMEQRFRERYGQVLKQRLGLTDNQMSQVAEVNQRLDPQRRELFGQERELRKSMRDALLASEDAAAQERIAQLLEQTLRIQRQRLELVETEQRELASFLSPMQRAKYLGMQEHLRRRVDEMHRRAAGDSAGADSFPIGAPERARRGMRKRPGL